MRHLFLSLWENRCAANMKSSIEINALKSEWVQCSVHTSRLNFDWTTFFRRLFFKIVYFGIILCVNWIQKCFININLILDQFVFIHVACSPLIVFFPLKLNEQPKKTVYFKRFTCVKYTMKHFCLHLISILSFITLSTEREAHITARKWSWSHQR